MYREISKPRRMQGEVIPVLYRRNQLPAFYRDNTEHLVKLDLKPSNQFDYNDN